MKRTSFQYRRWFVIDATPAQFGGLVEGLNSLFSTDEGLQLVYGQWRINRPFHVYGLPLPSYATPVVVRFPGDGEIDWGYRDPRFGWIDAIARLDGKTELAMTYNFDTPVLPLDARLHLWNLLFSWLEEAGCPVQGIDDETEAPAMIGGEEGQGKRLKPGLSAPPLTVQLRIWQDWKLAEARGTRQGAYCQLEGISPSTLRNYRRNLEAAKMIT